MTLTKKELLPGDHVYVRRRLHSHHGIYVGKDRVIHYKGLHKEKKNNPVVQKTSMDEFSGEVSFGIEIIKSGYRWKKPSDWPTDF